jgi:hypothetical protein
MCIRNEEMEFGGKDCLKHRFEAQAKGGGKEVHHDPNTQ